MAPKIKGKDRVLLSIIKSGAAHDLAVEVGDYADLLVVVLTGPDAAQANDGMYRVAHQIRDKARLLKEALKCV